MRSALPEGYPYDEDNVFGVCKACGSIIPMNVVSMHKNKCSIPAQLRLKIEGSLYTILSGAEINEMLLIGKPFPVHNFSEMEIQFYKDFQTPYEDEELNRNFQNSIMTAVPDEEYRRRREERRRLRELRSSYKHEEEEVNEEEEERRRKERREKRRQRREAEAALEEDRRREEARQLEQDAKLFISIIEEEEAKKRQEEEEAKKRQEEKRKLEVEEQARLQMELARLRQKVEEEKRKEEEKKKKRKEEEEQLRLKIERQRSAADLLKQREIERLKREKECEIQTETPRSLPDPDEESVFDRMLRKEEEEKKEEEDRRKVEERNWQKRQIELELNHPIVLSECKEIKRRGVPRPAKPVVKAAAKPSKMEVKPVMQEEVKRSGLAQSSVNKNWAIPIQFRKSSIPKKTNEALDLGVNPFDEEEVQKNQLRPRILPKVQRAVVNPFGREEDVLNRLENHQETSSESAHETLVKPRNPFDTIEDETPRNPFDRSESSSGNPFDTVSDATPRNPFDTMDNETPRNPFDRSESSSGNPFDRMEETPRNPFDINSSSNSILNPFERLSLQGKTVNAFDSSDEGDDELGNPFDRDMLASETSTPMDLRESINSRGSVWNDAVKVLALANNPDVTSKELQHQMEIKQEEKQLNAVSEIYSTNGDEYLSFVDQIFEGIECWKWCSNGKYHRTVLRVFDVDDQRILQWDRKRGLFKEKTSEIDCSTIRSVENIPGTNQIVIECERTVIFECFTKSSLISLLPGLQKMCLERF